jgi:L-threonylcarbamoyladenylate synthase
VERVLSIKGPGRRVGERPIPVIIGGRHLLPRVARELSPLAESLAQRHWPGPLTLLLPAIPGLPAPLVGSSGLVGVRLPGPCPAADLARAGGLVLTATSANSSGGADPLSHEEIAGLPGVDLVIPGAVPGPPGSTVVDPTDGRPRIVRPGFVSIEEG